MTVGIATQIEIDDRGVPWIAGTKVKVTEIVLDKPAQGRLGPPNNQELCKPPPSQGPLCGRVP
jgi:hypothetical protein